MCVIVHTCQGNMTYRKGNTIGFRKEEQLAEVVNEILNDSEIIFPNFQVVKRANLKVQMRVIMRVKFQNRALTTDRQMLSQLQGFLKMIVDQEYYLS